MLKTIGYDDMGVVKEFTEGSHLLGACDVTGLSPKKFAPGTMTIDGLQCTAAKERELQWHLHVGVGDADVQLKEVETGALAGPINLEDADATFPLSRRFGVQQGQKVRCVHDFTRSGVNACAQVVESPRPHTLDTIAALCMSLMAGPPSKEQWKSRFLCGQRTSACFAHIAAFDPTTKTTFAFRMRALPFGSVKPVRSFLRVAHSLWAILVKEFMVAWTIYFDDFVTG